MELSEQQGILFQGTVISKCINLLFFKHTPANSSTRNSLLLWLNVMFYTIYQQRVLRTLQLCYDHAAQKLTAAYLPCCAVFCPGANTGRRNAEYSRSDFRSTIRDDVVHSNEHPAFKKTCVFFMNDHCILPHFDFWFIMGVMMGCPLGIMMEWFSQLSVALDVWSAHDPKPIGSAL